MDAATAWLWASLALQSASTTCCADAAAAWSAAAKTPAKAELVLRPELTARRIEWPAAVETGWHYVKAGEVTQPGNHWHHCQRCGRAIQHGPENNGDVRAHTCPCGAVHWHKAPKPAPAPRNVGFAKPMATLCPT